MALQGDAVTKKSNMILSIGKKEEEWVGRKTWMDSRDYESRRRYEDLRLCGFDARNHKELGY